MGGCPQKLPTPVCTEASLTAWPHRPVGRLLWLLAPTVMQLMAVSLLCEGCSKHSCCHALQCAPTKGVACTVSAAANAAAASTGVQNATPVLEAAIQ